MRTALDTNVLIAIWDDEPESQELIDKLGQAQLEGSIVVCGVVFAEAMAHRGSTEASVREYLRQAGVDIAFDMSEMIWMETGKRNARYAARRRRSLGGETKRLLADLMVGAHALIEADQLMTLDRSRYERDFPELKLI